MLEDLLKKKFDAVCWELGNYKEASVQEVKIACLQFAIGYLYEMVNVLTKEHKNDRNLILNTQLKDK